MKKILLLLVFSFCVYAKSGPFIGFIVGGSDGERSMGYGSSSDFGGFYGGRLGYNMDIVPIVGLRTYFDLTYSDYKDSANVFAYNINLDGVVTILPKVLDIYGGVGYGGATAEQGFTKIDDSGFIVNMGVILKFIPIVDVEAGMKIPTYKIEKGSSSSQEKYSIFASINYNF